MKYIFIVIFGFITFVSPLHISLAEVGGTITRTSQVPYEQLSYPQKLEYLMERLIEIQALLLAFSEQMTKPSSTEIINVSALIDYIEQETTVTIARADGQREELVISATNKDNIIEVVASEYGLSTEVIEDLLEVVSRNADTSKAVTVRFRDNRSITIRQEQWDGVVESTQISSTEIMDEFLVPVFGSETLATIIYDGLVTDIRQGNVSDEMYSFIAQILEESDTAELRDAITFQF